MSKRHSSRAEVVVHTQEDIDAIESRVRRAAAAIPALLASEGADGLAVLRRMKFDAIGLHPVEDRPLNLIEQVNQTFSCLVSLRAVRLLMDRHPDAGGFRLNLGPHRGTDVESLAPGLVAAEAFAAVTTGNNGKLRKDLDRMLEHTARHRYVFFCAPGHPEGPYRGRVVAEGVTIWAVEV